MEEAIKINNIPLRSISRTLIVRDHEEYEFGIRFSGINPINVKIVFKASTTPDQSGVLNWEWGERNSVKLIFAGWTNSIGLTALTSRTEIGQADNARFSIDAAAQHVGSLNFLNITFYVGGV